MLRKFFDVDLKTFAVALSIIAASSLFAGFIFMFIVKLLIEDHSWTNLETFKQAVPIIACYLLVGCCFRNWKVYTFALSILFFLFFCYANSASPHFGPITMGEWIVVIGTSTLPVLSTLCHQSICRLVAINPSLFRRPLQAPPQPLVENTYFRPEG